MRFFTSLRRYVPVQQPGGMVTGAQLDDDFKSRKRQLDIAQREASLRKVLAEAERAEHDAALRGLERHDEERVARWNNEHDARKGVYWFNGVVNAGSSHLAINWLRINHRLDPEQPFTIVFNSPGGSVIDGMALFDEITTLSVRGGGTHEITTQTRGYAASMAGILLQSGDIRKMGRESYLMIHEVSSGAMGKIGEIKDEVDFLNTISNRVVDIFVDRSEGKTSRAGFKKLWDRKDAWLSSDAALKAGFIDDIG